MIYLLNSVIRDTHMISGVFAMLWSGIDTVVKVSKYQVYLVIGHLLLGTMPRQIKNQDTCFGRFMTVYNDEDQVSSKEVLDFRLNKLKSIAKYLCIFKKRA